MEYHNSNFKRSIHGFNQWFSNFIMHQNHPESLVKYPTPRVSVSVSLKWVWDFAFLRNAADQATTLWKPLDQATSEFLSSSVILILWVCNYKWNYYFPYANIRLKIFSETTVLSYEYNQQRIDSLIHSFKQDSGPRKLQI